VRQLSDEAAAAALAYVRAVIAAGLGEGPEPAAPALPELEQPAGAFVSLHKAGHLRGCMGWLEWSEPLARVLRRVARNAAFEDPRFPALKPAEWPQCEVEISVLEPARPVAGPEEIVIGRHGVILEARGRRAVYLPQVAVEQGWTLEETLTQLSLKAGLPPDAWRQPGCRLEVFAAQILREGRRRGR
jgi:AmmeMemoRadiSam system protein A